jgi:tripartite-type tricarboxylate transporter receptor subunit TctC
MKVTPVHYRSGSDVLRSLIQNETDFGFISVHRHALRPGRQGAPPRGGVGRARPALPQVPPAAAAAAGVEATTWHGIVGPAGLPAEIVSAPTGSSTPPFPGPRCARRSRRSSSATWWAARPRAFAAFIRKEAGR